MKYFRVRKIRINIIITLFQHNSITSCSFIKEKFGFLLDAFKFGAPPHAGIALGWDRTVSILAGADTIRDVIAFPKAGGGRDPLTGAPAPISDEQRAETGVDYDPDAED